MASACRRSDHRNARGAALLLCMVFIAAITSTAAMLSMRAIAQVRHAEYAAYGTAALAAAEAAQARALADLRNGGSGAIGFKGQVTWDEDGRPLLPVIDSADVDEQVFSGPPSAIWYTATATRSNLPPDILVLYAVARVAAVERRLEVVLRHSGSGAYEQVSWRECPRVSGKEAPLATLYVSGE